ncbi:acyl-CoA dehydrogenase family protein [Deinococcus marmoris]|uniref:Acyl-CoA dehydrogenase/oxidase domain protein n=1 Tax=Deinococcus marmoris TaxID=249408 RepID=A0A1U7NU98_9DEIO|nr:acyl-CoA dehydrogenase family protein [Deinococcus marmoris]OLV16477.1 Acyl-CoA dehydrogenase/oxidase domain protein [Deinococcus marmoris]
MISSPILVLPPAGPPAPPLAPGFRSFYWGGFECSAQRRPSGRRIDVIDATAHDRFAVQDYARLAASGMLTARDGLRWHLIERVPGDYDFSSAHAQVTAAREAGVQVVWDLLHYGFPDFVDPFGSDFPASFARYAAAAARFLREETDGTLWLCPINEISFTAWGGGDVGYLNPFAQGRGLSLKAQLVRAAIAGMDAAREVDPGVRFLHAEPLISVHAHPERPHEAGDAARSHTSQFEALDMLLGRLLPELGGAERYVDVVGLNYYPYNQWRHHPEPHLRETVPMAHPDHRPLHTLLAEVHARYARSLVLAETGAEGEDRAPWFEMIVRETGRARKAGMPLYGACLYPVVNHPGWDDDRHCHNGLWDYPGSLGDRAVHAPLADVLTRAQAQENQDQEDEVQQHPGTATAPGPAPLSAVLARFARAEPTIATEAAARDQDGAFPAASFEALREAGVLAASLPTGLDGQGLTGARLLALLRRVGRASLPVGRVYEGHVNALYLILSHGTPAQVQRAAADARHGELFGIWNTEDGPGLRLERAEIGESWTLIGGKTFTSGADFVTRPLLPAEWPQGGGRVLALLPHAAPPERFDPAFWQPLGMRPTVSFRVDLTGLTLGADDVIGQPGDYDRQPDFSGGALRFLAVQLGGADAVLEAGRDVLRQLGRTSEDIQRLRFGAVAARLEAAWQTVLRGAAHLEGLHLEGAETDELARVLAYVALAREVTEDACLLACEAVERTVGARGLLAPQPAERLLRDLRMSLHQPDSDAGRLHLGRAVLDAPELADDAYSPWSDEGL